MKKIGEKRKINTLQEPALPEPDKFLNRELSWLEFNRRVLEEAIDERTPLLERIRFLGIFTSNLDEFFMKRVGAFKRQIAAGLLHRSADGLTPHEQIIAIRQKIVPMLEEESCCFNNKIDPELKKNGIVILEWKQLTEKQRGFAEDYFNKNVFPVLTPLMVDSGHPFPFISNLSTSLGLIVKNPLTGDTSFARVKIPPVLPQYIAIPHDSKKSDLNFISLMSIIQNNAETLFPKMEIVEMMPFRITRNADVEREEEDADDLLALIEQEIKQRKFEKAVRLEYCGKAGQVFSLLCEELELTEQDTYELKGILDYTTLKPISELNIPQLHYPQWNPVVLPQFAERKSNIFNILKKSDVLLHHPYEDFTTSVEHFLSSAVNDPAVLAIKMTLYRTGEESPFVPMLIRAAEAGKQVVSVIELKARFDEERNIYWAQMMEKAGIHVVYGIVGLKTHAKTTLVVRREGDTVRCYAHIGTGNYHTQTARLYTDLGLLTSNELITADIVELFNFLTGYSMKKEYRKLMVAPINMRERFLEFIEREITNCKAGKPAGIIAKMNSLEDDKIIKALYNASEAGVEIKLIVRGFCCLKPKVPNLSSNISVLSVIGRFLEHSRIFYFRNGAKNLIDGELFIGSADWMYRNLLARVEIITPIEQKSLKQKCLEILDVILRDTRQAWEMQSDGSYTRRTSLKEGEKPIEIGTHNFLMNLTMERNKA
jgi:polyphosphate kinase